MTTEPLPPNARARASRRNGARSHGPVTAAGRAISARNSLKHGLRARRLVLLDDEDAAAFRAFAEALRAELAPEGALQTELVARIALAAWRARRSDRVEAALFARYLGSAAAPGPAPDLGAALVRDGHGPRAFDTLLRYRGATLAEFWRALAALRALQAGARAGEEPGAATVLPPPPPARESERTQDPQESWAPAAGDAAPGGGA